MDTTAIYSTNGESTNDDGRDGGGCIDGGKIVREEKIGDAIFNYFIGVKSIIKLHFEINFVNLFKFIDTLNSFLIGLGKGDLFFNLFCKGKGELLVSYLYVNLEPFNLINTYIANIYSFYIFHQ